MKQDKWHQTRKNNGQTIKRSNATLAVNFTKGKLLEKSQRCHGSTTKAQPPNRAPTREHRQNDDINHNRWIRKLITPRLRFGETVDASEYSMEIPPQNIPKFQTILATEYHQRIGSDDKTSERQTQKTNINKNTPMDWRIQRPRFDNLKSTAQITHEKLNFSSKENQRDHRNEPDKSDQSFPTSKLSHWIPNMRMPAKNSFHHNRIRKSTPAPPA